MKTQNSFSTSADPNTLAVRLINACATRLLSLLLLTLPAAGGAQVVTNDPLVLQFIASHNITDPLVKYQIAGCVSELKAYGITNFDLLMFHSNYGP
jgi:hypothetical protein